MGYSILPFPPRCDAGCETEPRVGVMLGRGRLLYLCLGCARQLKAGEYMLIDMRPAEESRSEAPERRPEKAPPPGTYLH